MDNSSNMWLKRNPFILCCLLILSGCQSQASVPSTDTRNITSSLTPTFTITATRLINPSPAPSETPLPEPTSLSSTESDPPIITEINSPLEGIGLDELKDILSNPYVYAGDGKDEGHHGSDFSFYRYKDFLEIENLPVISITSGIIRASVNNRLPYGNMVIIESPLNSFSPQLQTEIQAMVKPRDLPYYTILNCPDYLQESLTTENLSLYFLYAHLKNPPGFKIGDPVENGTVIGLVGNSGASGNPHLHLEVRIGPSDNEFSSMAHYENSATSQEMANYCLWRVSGFFYQIDPMEFFNLAKK